MILLSGSSHPAFSRELAHQSHLSFGDVEISVFPNGERRVWVKSPVAHEDVVIVQSFSQPVDTHFMEYALLVDAVERAGARSITAVVPWMGYSLQDKVFRSGEPIAARVAADIVSNRRVKRVILLDLHSDAEVDFFSVPTTVLSSLDLFAQNVKKHYGTDDVVVISPDFGGLKRASVFASRLGVEIDHIDKVRDLHTGKVQATFVGGDLAGKTCVVLDDIINTGSTVVEGAGELRKHGAKKIVFYATHPLLAGDAPKLLQASDVDEVVVGDTVAVGDRAFPKLRTVSMISVFAHALTQLNE